MQSDNPTFGYGYNISVVGEWTVGAVATISGGKTYLVFSSGDYSGYPYKYLWGEPGDAFGWDPGSLSLNVEACVALGIGTQRSPGSLEGEYDVALAVSSDANMGIPIAGTTMQFNIPKFPFSNIDQFWVLVSGGFTGGVSAPNYAGPTLSVTSTLLNPDIHGYTIMETNEIKTKDRNLFMIAGQWARFVAPLGGPIAAGIDNLISLGLAIKQ